MFIYLCCFIAYTFRIKDIKSKIIINIIVSYGNSNLLFKKLFLFAYENGLLLNDFEGKRTYM